MWGNYRGYSYNIFYRMKKFIRRLKCYDLVKRKLYQFIPKSMKQQYITPVYPSNRKEYIVYCYHPTLKVVYSYDYADFFERIRNNIVLIIHMNLKCGCLSGILSDMHNGLDSVCCYIWTGLAWDTKCPGLHWNRFPVEICIIL